MSLFPELVLASNNPGKLREFSAFFAPYQINVIPQGQLGVGECEEPYHTFLENALAKARHASRATGKPALADDSGICVNALNGAPGVRSARFGGEPKSDAQNNRALIQALEGHTEREAWYVCVLVLVRSADDPAPLVAQGMWQGQVIDEARGSNGFGYDPHFYLPEYQQTAAEISATLKNRISHRGRAMMVLMQELDELCHRAGLAVPEESVFGYPE